MDPTPTAKEKSYTPAIGLDAAKMATYEEASKEEPGGVTIYSSKSGAVYPTVNSEEEPSTSTCEPSLPSL